MPILTPAYRAAIFMRVKDFDASSLAGLPRVTKSDGGFIIRSGSRHAKCLIRQIPKKDIIIVETDDSQIRKSVAKSLEISARAKGKPLERITIRRSKALEFLRSFESDGMTEQGKLTVFYGDMATRTTPRGPRKKYRNKIHFNIGNSDEARKISDQLQSEIRGFALTIASGGKRDRAFIFFDARPTCRMTRAGRPVDAALHEEMARRFVEAMS